MATEIALLSMEREYTGASVALQKAIPVMELLKERRSLLVIAKRGSIVSCMKTIVELWKYFGTRSTDPEQKHLLVKLHHFRDYVTRGEIIVHPIRTHDQQADYLTKPVNESTLRKLRGLVQGW
jgi:hypothetical protein